MGQRLDLLRKLCFMAYPFLVVAACRHGVVAQGHTGVAILVLALGLPLFFLVKWAVSVLCKTWQAWSKRLLMLLLMAVCIVGLWDLGPFMQKNFRWFFLLQDLGFFVLFAFFFGSTLLPGKEPLCTFFARHIHKHMSPALLAYTRSVTAAWTWFFVVGACVSTLLFFATSPSIWAFFSYLVMPVLTFCFFVAENLYRRRVLPPEDCCGLVETFRSFQNSDLLRKRNEAG